MNERRNELSEYRMNEAESTLKAAETLLQAGLLKDSINRSYYAVFYAVKSVLAIEGVDFKRHKDVIAYFNQHYVATEIFSRELGKKIGRCKQKRETSDYDDFYVASKEEAEEQIQIAHETIEAVLQWHESWKQTQMDESEE